MRHYASKDRRPDLLGNETFGSTPGGTFNSPYVGLTDDIFRFGVNWKFNSGDPATLYPMY
jgi:hypothetical protein